jgi:4-hydroxybenzoate polyprenyltransferase
MGIYLTIPIEYTLAQRQVHKKPIIAQTSVVIGAIGLIVSAIFFSLQIWQLILPFGLISLTYSIPLIPTLNGWKRLRDIPGLKIYVISFVVTITTSTIPLILMNQINSNDIWLFGFQRFFFILAITIPFDIRDFHLDKKWNLKTIPLLLNNEKALKLALTFLALPTIISFFQFYTHQIFGFEIVMAAIITQIWSSYILTLFKTHNAPLFNAFMVEGTMVFQFAITTTLVVVRSLM